VDLSYNNVGAGAALVMGSLAKKLAEVRVRLHPRLNAFAGFECPSLKACP